MHSEQCHRERRERGHLFVRHLQVGGIGKPLRVDDVVITRHLRRHARVGEFGDRSAQVVLGRRPCTSRQLLCDAAGLADRERAPHRRRHTHEQLVAVSTRGGEHQVSIRDHLVGDAARAMRSRVTAEGLGDHAGQAADASPDRRPRARAAHRDLISEIGREVPLHPPLDHHRCERRAVDIPRANGQDSEAAHRTPTLRRHTALVNPGGYGYCNEHNGGQVRVLRVSHSAAVDEWRGRERALVDLGVDVSLLSARRSHEGAGAVTLEPRPGEAVTGVGTVGRHPALFVYDPRPIWRALGEPVDVVDIHEEPFALATAEILLLRRLRRNRAPVVLYTAQNLDKRYPVPFRWFQRAALRTASGISACSIDAADITVAKGFAGAPRVIPLGIDLQRFQPADAADDVRRGDPVAADNAQPDEATTPSPPSTITVGFLGRLVVEKGVEVLLLALLHEPTLRARFAGTGPLATELTRRAADLGISDRVGFVGAVAPDAVVEFYRSVDVIAMPSLTTPSWTEQFGRVAVEAMACGVPVVASDAGALPDVVAGAGIVVAEGNARALGAALVEAAGPRREELRTAGFTRAAECTWDAVARDYLELYHSVLHDVSAPLPRGVEIFVVAYGTPDLLRQALDPVRSLPVTVVDNSSLPAIAALCDELGVRYLDAGANLGFAAGVNLGLAHRQHPGWDVLLLNPDARIDPELISPLQAQLLAEPDLASIAPAQVDEQGRTARVEWPFPTPANAWREAVGLSNIQRGAQFVIGSVLMLRAEALAQVGELDEDFFLYAEETDWAYRAHRLGWRHRVSAGVTALHVGAGTSTDDRRREAHFHASQERYLRKHFGALGWQSTRAAVWSGAMLRSAILPGERGKIARRRAALYRLGPLRVEARLYPRTARD